MIWLSDLWQDLKAWRRGERRIKPGRGRVYAKKGEVIAMQPEAPRQPTATITAKVIRADGSIEIHEASNVRVENGDSSNDSRP